ncbi:unnamed protein product [Paramecium sonneborni]|uniref:Uncharacterized protein n=1 Tax=Paramecium sonneborni TaxID=65129 RepID=A0A8S1MVR6_9CILI|nr:unnamed protein product [Paramecium sonneborni]
MKKFLVLAFLVLCITAKKHHKSEDEGSTEQTDPMVQCLSQNCMNEAFGCFFDEECGKTMEACDAEHGENMNMENLASCTSNNELASAFANCMQTNCASFEQVMRFFNRRK